MPKRPMRGGSLKSFANNVMKIAKPVYKFVKDNKLVSKGLDAAGLKGLANTARSIGAGKKKRGKAGKGKAKKATAKF